MWLQRAGRHPDPGRNSAEVPAGWVSVASTRAGICIPAQLPTRFLATYAFYRDGFTGAATRLHHYTQHANSAVLDEPATARALARFIYRGVTCGTPDRDSNAGPTIHDVLARTLGGLVARSRSDPAMIGVEVDVAAAHDGGYVPAGEAAPVFENRCDAERG